MRLRAGTVERERRALLFAPALPGRRSLRSRRLRWRPSRPTDRGAPRRSRRRRRCGVRPAAFPPAPLGRSVPATSGAIAPPGRGGGFTTLPCQSAFSAPEQQSTLRAGSPPSPARPAGGARSACCRGASRSVARPSARRSGAGLMKYPSDPPPLRAPPSLHQHGPALVSGIFHYPAPADSCVTHRSRTTLPGTSTTFFAALAGRAAPEAPLRLRQRGASPLRRSRCRGAASPRRHLLVDHTPATVAAQSGQAPAAVMRFSRIV